LLKNNNVHDKSSPTLSAKTWRCENLGPSNHKAKRYDNATGQKGREKGHPADYYYCTPAEIIRYLPGILHPFKPDADGRSKALWNSCKNTMVPWNYEYCE
jgi:hypothetical protein